MGIKMISYWQEVEEIYDDSGMIIIIGKYNHKNKNKEGNKALGIHWKHYPLYENDNSQKVLSPFVVAGNTRNAILSGLLHQAILKNETDNIASITKAIDYFRPQKQE
jgi:hypothetical protein